MKIEVLYSEVANLYGDLYNINYLAKCLPNVKVHYTNLNDTPLFVNHKVDLIYMGPMMENHQKIVIEKLLPYKDRIKELIENNVIFLICGNALEIFGSNETLTSFVTDSSLSSLYEPLGSTELLEFTEEQSLEFSIYWILKCIC